MRRFFTISIFLNLLISVGPLLSSTAQAQVNPWPWAKLLPFPWDSIDGTWTESNTLYTFSFKMVENSSGERHIIIKQIDTSSGQVVAKGLGVENSPNVVHAAMTGGQQKQYLLTVRRLSQVYCWDKQEFTGVTIETPDHEHINHFQIHKIKEIPLTPFEWREYKKRDIDFFDIHPACWDDIING